jgi:hypothetical protein
MATQSAQQNFVRRGGSGWTIFTFAGQPITFCQQVSHTSPVPVGQGVSAIQPMDEPYPVELVTPAAAGMGQLVLNMYELFGSNGYASKVWDRLGMNIGNSGTPFGTAGLTDTSAFLTGSSGPFAGAVDIVDIFIRQAKINPQDMSVMQIVRPPANATNPNAKPYFIQYMGCVITNVTDGETIDVGTLEILKTVTIAYRYQLRDGVPSQAFTTRDAPLPSAAGSAAPLG